ncbi:hypothetical protein AUL38_10740 [Leucobacter sp. G161]|nr:hypothetical protein AUL38_10740 [Leucobacter sp. G161]
MNDRRYAAEAEYLEAFNLSIDRWMSDGISATQARAKANVEALPQYRSWLALKGEYHQLEGLSKALTTRIYSLLNINKGVQAAYNTHRGP